MRDSSYFSKIYIAIKPVDFRRQAHGLALIVEETLDKRVSLSKTLFVFTNRRKTAVKCLYWDTTGLAMWWKKLEKEHFKWPKDEDQDVHTVSPRELNWLLEGVDLSSIKKHKKIAI